MKHKGIILMAVVLAIAVGVGVFLIIENTPAKKNDRILAGLLNDFSKAISEHSQAEIVKTKGICGKMYGNGNGMQYFGAVLIERDSIENMDTLLAQLDKTFEIVAVGEQKGQDIQSKYLVNLTLSYDTAISDDAQYISIWFFNSHHPDSDLRDIRGH